MKPTLSGKIEEHYEAQSKYGDMLIKFLEIPKWRHPIKSWKAFNEAEQFKKTHIKCCEWANEIYD